MDRNQVMRKLQEQHEEFSRLGVKSLAVFGSVARDNADLQSDVDVIVEFEGAATFDGYMELKFLLERLLACKVDLVTRKALKPRLRPYVEADAMYVT